MQLIEQETTNWLAIAVAPPLLAVFAGLSALDVVTRFCRPERRDRRGPIGPPATALRLGG